MIDSSKIREDLMVHAKGEGEMEGSEGIHLGTVDHLDGDYIKLKRMDDPEQRHHWIPIAWVEDVDDQTVYLDRPVGEVQREWFTMRPADPLQRAS